MKLFRELCLTSLLVSVFLGCGGGGGGGTTPQPGPDPDTSVDAFTIASVTDAELNAEVISNSVTISGINRAVAIGVNNCSYSVNQQAFTETSGTVNNGDSVRFQVIASGEYDTETTCEITVSQYSTSYSVTTLSNQMIVTTTQKTASRQYSALTPTNIFTHGINGENISQVTVTGSETELPNTSGMVSYSVFASLDTYGDTEQTLDTYLGETDSRDVRFSPHNPGYLFDDCKTVGLSKSVKEQDEADLALFTSAECNNSIGSRTSYTPSEIDVDVTTSEDGLNDLLYFTQDLNANFLGYKLLSSGDYADQEVINGDDLILDTAFSTVSLSFNAAGSGNYAVYSTDDTGLGFLLGEFDFQQGAVSEVVNVANITTDEYYQRIRVMKNSQSYSERVVEAQLTTLYDTQITPTYFTDISMDNYTLSWTLDNTDTFDNVWIRISSTATGSKRWTISAPNTGSVTLPIIDQLNNKDYLSDARISISLSKTDEQTGIYSSVFVSGTIECVNDVCSMSFNL